MPDKETKFVCFCPGDPSVGISGSQATVSLHMHPEHDKEDLEFVRGELKTAFTNIFDDKHTQVLTSEEIDALDAAEERLFSDLDACERDTLETFVSESDIMMLRDEEGDTMPPPDGD